MKAVNVSSLKNNPCGAGALSLARSARLAHMTLANFITHVSRLGIPVINQTAAEVQRDMDTLDQWLAS